MASTERRPGRNLIDARIVIECYRTHRERQGDFLGLYTEPDLITALLTDLFHYADQLPISTCQTVLDDAISLFEIEKAKHL